MTFRQRQCLDRQIRAGQRKLRQPEGPTLLDLALTITLVTALACAFAMHW